MKILKTVLLLLGCSLILNAATQWIAFEDGNQILPQIEILSASYEETVVQFKLSGFYTEDIQIDGTNYLKISVPDLTTLHRKGYPDFPKFAESILIADELIRSM